MAAAGLRSAPLPNHLKAWRPTHREDLADGTGAVAASGDEKFQLALLCSLGPSEVTINSIRLVAVVRLGAVCRRALRPAAEPGATAPSADRGRPAHVAQPAHLLRQPAQCSAT